MSIFAGEGLACVRGARMVFRGLDFRLEAGGALVLLGPNGSGKSSLLRLAAGLLRPFAGRLSWDRRDLAREPQAHRSRFTYVGHKDPVKAALTVAENVAYWVGCAGASMDRAAAALAAVGLAELAELPARYLSSGQRRRLNLARLFIAAPAPALWLLDEPAAGLDDDAVAALVQGIAAHRGQGGMVMLATHGEMLLDGPLHLQLPDFAPAGGQAGELGWFAP